MAQPPVVALIPARKGSKRVINKNMQQFHGRPLAEWTLDLAREAGVFNKVYISTDDDTLAALAGGDSLFEVFSRPDELANDTATVLQVMEQIAAQAKLSPDTILVLLQVTAPLRVVSDITVALELFERHGRTRTVVSVSECLSPPMLTWEIRDDTLVSPFAGDQPLITRKQNYATSYYWNDVVLVDSIAGFSAPGRNLFGPAPVPLVIPHERGIGIDYPVQFATAEALFPPTDERKQA